MIDLSTSHICNKSNNDQQEQYQQFTSRELLTSAMVAVIPFLAEWAGARAKDRILCLHLIVCTSRPQHVISET